MQTCESCSMPIETGPYCQHCVDAEGKLQSFETRLSKMIDWLKGQDPDITDDLAEVQVRERMRMLPAWKNHPNLR